MLKQKLQTGKRNEVECSGTGTRCAGSNQNKLMYVVVYGLTEKTRCFFVLRGVYYRLW